MARELRVRLTTRPLLVRPTSRMPVVIGVVRSTHAGQVAAAGLGDALEGAATARPAPTPTPRSASDEPANRRRLARGRRLMHPHAGTSRCRPPEAFLTVS